MKYTRVLVFLLLFCSITTVFAQTDYFPGDTWRVSTPEEQGLSSERLDEMMSFIEDNYLQIEGVVIISNGYLVYEQYPSPEYDAETRHFLFSVTKSFTSALIGIALNQGLISDTSETMVSFFPDREIAYLDDGKTQVTVENLLMMRSGMKWDESSAGYDTPENDIYHINNGDGLQYCLDLPMVAEPGELWHYNTGSSHILSGIIRETSGMSTLDYAKTNLFTPIGIENVMWSADLGGTQKGGFDLQLTPRDMARFGYLYLNKGRWGDTQVVPEEWVTLSTSTQTTLNDELGYGYQWWTLPNINAYRASGLYGQQIFVAPDQDIVFVLTGHISPTQHELEQTLLETYVLDAIIEEEETTRIPGFPNTAIMLGVAILIASIPRVRRHQ
ncbi:MAG: beta-lactamase family protein [Candidatus Bathyarchaeota archaeon]|nr:beta-lactamase family protein [Candidatus Bathyarchaeota archaeon]